MNEKNQKQRVQLCQDHERIQKWWFHPAAAAAAAEERKWGFNFYNGYLFRSLKARQQWNEYGKLRENTGNTHRRDETRLDSWRPNWPLPATKSIIMHRAAHPTGHKNASAEDIDIDNNDKW